MHSIYETPKRCSTAALRRLKKRRFIACPTAQFDLIPFAFRADEVSCKQLQQPYHGLAPFSTCFTSPTSLSISLSITDTFHLTHSLAFVTAIGCCSLSLILHSRTHELCNCGMHQSSDTHQQHLGPT